MKQQNANDRLMEAYYQVIGDAHLDNLLNNLDSKSEIIKKISVPDSLNQWFDRFVSDIKKTENKEKRRKQYRFIGSKAAIFTAGILTLFGGLTLTVDGFRERIYNMMLDVQETHTEIQYWNNDTRPDEANEQLDAFMDPETQGGNYFPTYIPDGYALHELESMTLMTHVVYMNAEGEHMFFSQSTMDGTQSIDTEDAVVTYPVIDGIEGIMSEKEGTVILVWHNNTFSFTIIGQITPEEALKMADSLKMVEPDAFMESHDGKTSQDLFAEELAAMEAERQYQREVSHRYLTAVNNEIREAFNFEERFQDYLIISDENHEWTDYSESPSFLGADELAYYEADGQISELHQTLPLPCTMAIEMMKPDGTEVVVATKLESGTNLLLIGRRLAEYEWTMEQENVEGTVFDRKDFE